MTRPDEIRRILGQHGSLDPIELRKTAPGHDPPAGQLELHLLMAKGISNGRKLLRGCSPRPS